MTSEVNLQWVKQLPYLSESTDQWCQYWLQVHHMTQTLCDVFGNIKIEVIEENWTKPYEFETTMLGLTTDCIWLRSALLKTETKPLIYARAAMTSKTINTWPQLKSLGSQSLGEIFLHRHKDIERCDFYYACLTPKHPLIKETPLHLDNSKTIWARCSLFKKNNLPLLVLTEVMLPPLVECNRERGISDASPL